MSNRHWQAAVFCLALLALAFASYFAGWAHADPCGRLPRGVLLFYEPRLVELDRQQEREQDTLYDLWEYRLAEDKLSGTTPESVIRGSLGYAADATLLSIDQRERFDSACRLAFTPLRSMYR